MSGKEKKKGEKKTGKKGGLVQQREEVKQRFKQQGALGSPGVRAANARFTCKCLDCETDITHLESRGESQRILGDSGGLGRKRRSIFTAEKKLFDFVVFNKL